MKRVFSLFLILCLLLCAGCGETKDVGAESLSAAQKASEILENAGYRVALITDEQYLLDLTVNMNTSGHVEVKSPMTAYLEATNAVSGGDAIEIYAFGTEADAENVAAYLAGEYVSQKYQVYRSGGVVCLGTLDAIELLK